MRAYDANSSYLGEAMSEPITYVTDWERRHVTWTLPENTAHIRVEVVTSGAGTAWADCFQLESGYTMNEYNLLENSDFANGSTCWSASNTTSADGVANYNDSTGDAYRLYGSADLNKLAYQKVFVNKKAGDIVFRISGNAHGNAVPVKDEKRYFAIGNNGSIIQAMVDLFLGEVYEDIFIQILASKQLVCSVPNNRSSSWPIAF